MKQKYLFAITMVLMVTLAGSLYSKKNNRGVRTEKGYMEEAFVNILPYEEISDIEKEALLKMREEEKLARDVYSVMYERWGLRVFDNISQAEQKHTDSIKLLLAKYNIADPVTDDTIGVFVDPELLDLYNQLIAKGSLSLIDALYVGATIEDVDIFDLQNYSLLVDNMDILFVFGNLKKGSENHMRAFVRLLNNYQVDYKAQYITQEELEAILSAGNENGRNGRGGGNGRG